MKLIQIELTSDSNQLPAPSLFYYVLLNTHACHLQGQQRTGV